MQPVDLSDVYALTSGWVPLNRNVILDFNWKFSDHIENPSLLFVGEATKTYIFIKNKKVYEDGWFLGAGNSSIQKVD